MAKRSKYADYAGFITSVKNRGGEAVVYDARQAGMDVDGMRYATSCETHGAVVGSKTKALAIAAAEYPEWCDGCRPKLDGCCGPVAGEDDWKRIERGAMLAVIGAVLYSTFKRK